MPNPAVKKIDTFAPARTRAIRACRPAPATLALPRPAASGRRGESLQRVVKSRSTCHPKAGTRQRRTGHRRHPRPPKTRPWAAHTASASIGQQRPVTVYRLVSAGSIEERIVALHHDKRSLADGILKGQDQGAPMGADELGALRVAGHGRLSARLRCRCPHPSLLRSNGRPTRGSGYFQDVSAESKCRANSMASCSTRPTTSRVGSKR